MTSESPLTWANLVTAIRTVACVVIFGLALVQHSPTLNLIGLGVYWLLDIVDGALARALHQETRIGAQFDILSDRLLVAFFYLNHLAWHPEQVIPISLFLVQFMLIDQYLSIQFLRWSKILSPNYFDRIDPIVFRLNWSWPAKMCNTGLVTLLLVVAHSIWWASLASLALSGIKIYSMVRVFQLDPAADVESDMRQTERR